MKSKLTRKTEGERERELESICRVGKLQFIFHARNRMLAKGMMS
jgi:hypothetical protein